MKPMDVAIFAAEFEKNWCAQKLKLSLEQVYKVSLSICKLDRPHAQQSLRGFHGSSSP